MSKPYECRQWQKETSRCVCVSSGKWERHTSSYARAAYAHLHWGKRLEFPSYYGIKKGSADCLTCEGHGFYWIFATAWCIAMCRCKNLIPEVVE